MIPELAQDILLTIAAHYTPERGVVARVTDRLLTNDEAAELLTVSRSTLYKLRGSGSFGQMWTP